MSAKTEKTIVERLEEEIKKRDIGIPEFEKQTGIPKDRVYKWMGNYIRVGTNFLIFA